MPLQLQDNKTVNAVGGKQASITLEISCHPQQYYVDPSKPDGGELGQLKSNQGVTIEQMIGAGPENLDDREKWHLLTRELVQKQEIVHRLMRENDDKT